MIPNKEIFNKLIDEKFDLLADDLKQAIADAMLSGVSFNHITYNAYTDEIKLTIVGKKNISISYGYENEHNN
ncbi:hypothetical protein BRC2024_OQYPJBKP_CDS_0095 [Acinetobacter phage vB_AbaM_Highwayman]|uniref:Uncharacterized protein n=4 Tax=Viruses TaxID=10239 RepID=A0A1V0DZA2_9CAUD|nr:hypothetical protein FDH41_gp33 [Acinetobacter phage WCHABP12]YP_009604567.1 hypothetical protein FDH91_gp76 [Acinetobacter phage WCHABP1]QEA11069.1 hypothetical protein Abp9_69 [Acinetobacter phage Abp9]QZI85389.1 hypothetical protein [Acinetobacter phage BUCT629]WHB31261.1 hypothetical protein [Acinetobacter phage P1068]WMC00284.1 hypothetical protein [Acinetobacter phage Ab31]WMC00485.1 hypothetical protein [Acinetobacter phage Ab59]WMC00570.1 hypothetical protein [Acinetobacter phage 